MTNPAPILWQHDSLTALATGLGVSVRTLENWRPRGAPLSAAPFDELAVRLWIAGEIASGKRMAKLKPPTPELAAYCDAITRILKAKPEQRADGDSDRALKRGQLQLINVRLAERLKSAQRTANDTFLATLGKLDQLFERDVAALAQSLWDMSNGVSSADALPLLQQRLRDSFTSIRRRALDR